MEEVIFQEKTIAATVLTIYFQLFIYAATAYSLGLAGHGITNTNHFVNFLLSKHYTFFIWTSNFKDIELETNLANVVVDSVDEEAAHRHRRRRVHKVRSVLAGGLRAHELEQAADPESRRTASLTYHCYEDPDPQKNALWIRIQEAQNNQK